MLLALGYSARVAQARRRRVPILVRLLGATLVPTVATFAAFGLLSHYIARRALEDELGRRLVAVASTAALAVRGERVDLLQPGDEASRTSRNVRRKLQELRDATGLARLYVVDAERTSRADTDDGVAIGTRYHTLDAAQAELRSALAGRGAASVLFTGRDGALYKSGYAPVRDDAGTIVAVVAADGSAELYAPLADFRRLLYLGSGAGAVAALLLSVLVARRITRPLRQLERSARAIGEGDLTHPVATDSPDEIGFLGETLETMRQQLRARDERLQMMLAGIAHEVRNPLGGVELFTGLLRDELSGQTEALSHVARIERELGHLKVIVSDFLEYARRAKPELRPHPAAAIVRDVHQVLSAEAESMAPPVRVRLVIEDEQAEAWCDPGQLRRALLNLGKNALQAVAATGGEVQLACRRVREHEHDVIRLSVKDSGPGIPPEARERLFAPFFTTREKGTGLGLAFVREIVQDHGGAVQVDSQPGAGATFTIALPDVKPRS